MQSSIQNAARRPTASQRGVELLPGLALVVLMAIVALALERVEMGFTRSSTPVVEALVIAILFGILLRNTIGQPASAAHGVSFAGKQLLEFAVLVLGASVNFAQLLQAGPRVLVLIVLCVGLAMLVSSTVGRLLGLNAKLAILVAVGNSICGNSAIAALAPVIKADKRDVTVAVALTAVVGVVLVLSLPLLVPLLHLTHYEYGVLAGTTVYAVPQVVAASFPIGPDAGTVATFVKLMRVLLIGPVVLGFSIATARAASATSALDRRAAMRRAIAVPWFVAGFLILAALNSLGLFNLIAPAVGLAPAAIPGAAQDGSKLVMIVSMAALGLGVEFAAVRAVGPRVFGTVVISIVFLVMLSLSLIFALGL